MGRTFYNLCLFRAPALTQLKYRAEPEAGIQTD